MSKPTKIFLPPQGITANISLVFDFKELASWPPEKIKAMLGGIGKVLAVVPSKREN